MRAKLIIFAIVSLFSLSTFAQKDAVKPLLFNVEKTLANADKLIAKDLTVQLKGNIIENIDGDYYWVQDETGKIKASISSDKIAELGEYNSSSIFYIIGKIKGDRDKYFEVSEIIKP